MFITVEAFPKDSKIGFALMIFSWILLPCSASVLPPGAGLNSAIIAEACQTRIQAPGHGGEVVHRDLSRLRLPCSALATDH